MKSSAYLFFSLLLLYPSSWAQEVKKNTILQRPWNKGECVAKGGKWVYFDIGQFYFCALNTTDEGKLCSDNDQCQGDCLPLIQSANEGESSKGQCATMFPMPGGCPKYIIKGKVVTEPCI
jgi:hypothetical protein